MLHKPKFVKFHDGAGKAFTMLVTHVNEDGSVSGAVWCHDTDNAAGLSDGWNARDNVNKGGPDAGDTWSPYEDHEEVKPG